MAERCQAQKMGKFSRLRCCLEVGHPGQCNFVVMGVLPTHNQRSRPRTRSDAEYEMRKQRRQQRNAGEHR